MKRLTMLLTTMSLLAVGAAAVAGPTPTTTTAPEEECTCSEDGPVFGPGLEIGDQTP